MHIEGLESLLPEGKGGFSQVFRATDRFGRTVAAKVLNFRLDDPDDRLRFERECRAMAQLSDHPHIVPLYSTTYTDEGYPVILMEFFAGGTLWSRARKGASPAELLDAGVKIASALHTAHERGVTHRDVKPQNVLMSRFGEPGLTDFGISAFDRHHADHGRPRGITIAYAAPEALDGVSSRRTDIYSLAATLYTVLADQRPFDRPGHRQSTAELIRRIVKEVPPSLQQFGYSSAIDHAVRRVGMARNPTDRPASAEAFGDLLRRVQSNEGYEVTPWIEARDLTDTSLPTQFGDESQAIIHQPGAGTQPHPAADPLPELDPSVTSDDGGSRRRTLATVAGIAAIALVGLVIALSGRGGDGSVETQATPEPIEAVDDDFYVAPLDLVDLEIVRLDDEVELTWTNPNTNPVRLEIQPVRDGFADGPLIEASGTRAVFDPGDDTCFTIRALGVRGGGRTSRDAEPACLDDSGS